MRERETIFPIAAACELQPAGRRRGAHAASSGSNSPEDEGDEEKLLP